VGEQLADAWPVRHQTALAELATADDQQLAPCVEVIEA
jgi:hypothetical protein